MEQFSRDPEAVAARGQDEEGSEEPVEGRPASRREMRTSQRERTLGRRISTAVQDGNWRPSSGMARIQGTASRLVSAASQQKASPVTISTPRLNTQVNATERLLTQQGLSSRARTASGLRGPGNRQVLDKRYYEGLLQLKIQEVTKEIATLKKQTEISNKEKKDFLIYDKQNKERAKELTDLQGILADYNLVIDKLHTGAEIKDIESETKSLKMTNDVEQQKLEQVFKERTQVQQQINHVENDLKKERHVAEKIVEAMSPEMRDKYTELSNKNMTLQKTIEMIQQQLDSLSKEKALLEQQMASSPLKMEAVKLEMKLLELEDKYNNLMVEENDNDADNLKQAYLNQVKENNIEIATMERSMNQLNEELNNYKHQLEQVEQDLNECESDRHKRYVDLKKREETIESFILTYEETKQKEKETADKLKSEIVSMLNATSEHLITLPTTEKEYELVNKELEQIGESEHNKQQSLYIQYNQKRLYFEQLQTLETKLQSEIANLHDRIGKTQSEIAIYENLDALKSEADAKRDELLQKKQKYLDIQDFIRNELNELRNKYEVVQKRLQENETHKQLQALERKLIQIEQDNFALKEFVTDKRIELNYEMNKKQAMNLVRKYNSDLKNKYSGIMREFGST